MNQIDRQQRLEELELAIADIFPSPKAPAVSVTDEESIVYLQISWVVESHADTTLDSRCACTVRFTGEQIDQYAAMDTAKRLRVQQRLKTLMRERFEANKAADPRQDDCAVEFAADGDLFDVPDDPAQ
jgi:hypothetical protein